MSQHCNWARYGDECFCDDCMIRAAHADDRRREYEQWVNAELEAEYNQDCREQYLVGYLLQGGASITAEWAATHFPPDVTNTDLRGCTGQVSGPWLHRGTVYYRMKWVEELRQREAEKRGGPS